MALKKYETDLKVILTALNDSNSKERSHALTRLKILSSGLSDKDFVKTKEILEKSLLSESSAKLKKRINYLVENNYKQREPEVVEVDFDEPEVVEMDFDEPEVVEMDFDEPDKKTFLYELWHFIAYVC